MGLLSRISAGIDLPAEESPLSQAGLSFFEFVTKHNLSHCAVFQRVNTFYVFSHSYGFDGDTVLQSISTSDFWEGTVEKNKWNYFSRDENNLNTVLQFFSMNLKTNISYVKIFMGNDKVLLTAFETNPGSENDLDTIAKDFLNMDFEKISEEKNNSDSSLILNMNIKDAVSEALGNLNTEIKTVMENAFLTETYAALKTLIEAPSSFYINDNRNISISIESKSHITKETLEVFLKNALKNIFKNATTLISYEY
ncbi:MAG: hypothetical protein MJ185_01840 [Treponema sp.]|nr:hypothetical protein [Treponema sp.]